MPIVGYIYTYLSTTAVSPFLYCFTMSWWVGGSLRTCSFLFFGLGAAAFRVDRARRGNVCLKDQAKACSPTDQPVRNLKDGLGINMTMKTFTLHITSCEKHSMVVYIYPTHGPRAWSLDDRSRLRAGGRKQWTVLSGTSAIGHGLHVADRAQGLTGT